ncbi:nascent polypeptide-associated complex, alpha subunit [Backusella circina FSU 941]|nr:nascent polypeptide-associated complex, alpha subunit [Backusella circina FSU 941]
MSAQEPVNVVEESIQSRGEKKARKALQGLGLKPVAGINRVTFTRGQGMVFSINNPDVFKSTNSDTHIVFGEMQAEDVAARNQAALNAQMEAEAAAKEDAPEGTEAPEAAAVEEDDNEEVDAEGIEEKDIELVVAQANVSRNKAIKALKNNDNDVVNSIMELTM